MLICRKVLIWSEGFPVPAAERDLINPEKCRKEASGSSIRAKDFRSNERELEGNKSSRKKCDSMSNANLSPFHSSNPTSPVVCCSMNPTSCGRTCSWTSPPMTAQMTTFFPRCSTGIRLGMYESRISLRDGRSDWTESPSQSFRVRSPGLIAKR